jgi:hypothetical protein
MTELEIDKPADQAYINIHHEPATDPGFFRNVTGGCLTQIPEEIQMVPNKTVASIFNGRDLKLINITTGKMIKTLQRDTYYEVDVDGNVTEVRVVRKLR